MRPRRIRKRMKVARAVVAWALVAVRGIPGKTSNAHEGPDYENGGKVGVAARGGDELPFPQRRKEKVLDRDSARRF